MHTRQPEMPARRLRPTHLPSPSDNDLEEDRQHFSATLIAFLPDIRRYATVWLGNSGEADELVQACMARALMHEVLPPPGQMRLWLLSLLHDLRQEPGGAGRGAGFSASLTSLKRLDDELLRRASGIERARLRGLLDGMGQLSEDERAVLLLVELEGLSYRDVSDVLNLPVGTVVARLAGTRERLRRMLANGDREAASTE